MATLQERYEREHPWGEDDLARAAGEHQETHGGVIAEASLETRSDTAADDMMRGAVVNDQAGGSVGFEDALDEEDEDLLGDPQSQGSAPNAAEGAGFLIGKLGDKINDLTSRRSKPGDSDGDGVPDEVDTDDDDDGIPDGQDSDADGDGQTDSDQASDPPPWRTDDDGQQGSQPTEPAAVPDPVNDPPPWNQYTDSKERMNGLKASLTQTPGDGGASGLDDLRGLQMERGVVTSPRGADAIDPRYRRQANEPPPRRGRGLGQFRLGR